MIKSYSEMIRLKTFEQRFEYLKIGGQIGYMTFNGHRYLNQELYKCSEWARVRRQIIIRDEGFDLAHPDHPINGKILVHHINPITIEDVLERNKIIFDPDNLITVSSLTHNAIHYGSQETLPKYGCLERKPDDTTLWR